MEPKVRTTRDAILEAIASGDVPLCGDGFYVAIDVHKALGFKVSELAFIAALESLERGGKVRLRRDRKMEACADLEYELLPFIFIYRNES